MDDVSVAGTYKAIYEDYHQGGVSVWRQQAAHDKARHIIMLCRDNPHRKIIEVGAGDGSILAELAAGGFSQEMYAVEIAESAVRTIVARNLPEVKACSVFNGYSVSYGDKEFDLAIASHVLEHVEHPRLFLRELNRISKRLFLEVPLEYNVQGVRDRKNSLKYGHINYFTPFLIDELLKTSGIKIVSRSIEDFSLRHYRYISGVSGYFKYFLRRALLRSCPAFAVKLFNYCYCVAGE